MADAPQQQEVKNFKYWSNLHKWHGQELMVIQATSILEADSKFETHSETYAMTILDAKGEAQVYRGLKLVKAPWISVETVSGPMFKAQNADNIQRQPLEKGEKTSDDQKQ